MNVKQIKDTDLLLGYKGFSLDKVYVKHNNEEVILVPNKRFGESISPNNTELSNRVTVYNKYLIAKHKFGIQKLRFFLKAKGVDKLGYVPVDNLEICHETLGFFPRRHLLAHNGKTYDENSCFEYEGKIYLHEEYAIDFNGVLQDKENVEWCEDINGYSTDYTYCEDIDEYRHENYGYAETRGIYMAIENLTLCVGGVHEDSDYVTLLTIGEHKDKYVHDNDVMESDTGKLFLRNNGEEKVCDHDYCTYHHSEGEYHKEHECWIAHINLEQFKQDKED